MPPTVSPSVGERTATVSTACDLSGGAGVMDVGTVRSHILGYRERRHLLLAGIVFVGFLLRAVNLGGESLWVDEIYTLRTVVDEGLAYIILVQPIQDPHPPFYYVVVDLWTTFVGTSAVTIRFVSLVASVASIPLVYAVGDRLYDRRVGLFAALLFAVSPFYVWYAREARMYALLTLLGLLSVYAMLSWLAGAEEWWRERWGYALASVALIYTHAFGALLVLAQNVYVVVFLGEDDADEEWFAGWIRIQAVVGAASIPWFYNLLGGMFGAGRFENNVTWIPPVTPATLWKILGSYVGRSQPPSSPTSRRSLWAVDGLADLSLVGEAVTLVALVLLVLPLAWYLRRHYLGGSEHGDTDAGGPADATDGDPADAAGTDQSADGSAESAGSGTTDGGERSAETAAAGTVGDGTPGDGPLGVGTPDRRGIKPGAYLGCWLLVQVGLLYAVSVLVTPLLFDRFTAVAGVAALIVVSRAVVGLASTDRQVLVAGGLVVLVLAVPLTSVYAQPQKQEWDHAATFVESNAEAGDTVVVIPTWANDSYQYYADRDDVNYPNMFIPVGAPRWQLAAATAEDPVAWVVVAHHNATTHQQLLDRMEHLGFTRDRHREFTELDVYRFVRREPGDS